MTKNYTCISFESFRLARSLLVVIARVIVVVEIKPLMEATRLKPSLFFAALPWERVVSLIADGMGDVATHWRLWKRQRSGIGRAVSGARLSPGREASST